MYILDSRQFHAGWADPTNIINEEFKLGISLQCTILQPPLFSRVKMFYSTPFN
jgi:hypothetical protein